MKLHSPGSYMIKMHDLTGPFDFFYNINKYQQTSASLLSTIRIFFTLSRLKFDSIHSFIHSFIFFIFFHLLRGLWLRFLRMLLLQRMPCTWIRGHIFLAASMRFSGLFCVQKTEASTQQAMTQAGRSCKKFGFSIFWGA